MTYKHPHGHVFYRKMSHARPKIDYGEGIYLFDEAGKRYMDGSGGPLVVNVGHGRSEIVAAMAEQAQKAAYVHAIMFTNQATEQLSEELAALVPIDNARFFYLSSGSEVEEGAIKLARQIQQARGENGRSTIISRYQSYHGMSLGALSVSGRPGLRAPYLGMLHDMPHIAPPYPYRDPVSGEEAADRLEAAILAAGVEHTAAFLAEPISGASLGAAGAICGPETLRRARMAGLEPETCLAEHDSGTFFERLDDLVVTGPTRTNVNDFRAILILPRQGGR